MGRYIDADLLKKRIMDSFPTLKSTAKGLCEIIDAQPTAFDKDKVVERLKNEYEGYIEIHNDNTENIFLIDRNVAIDIVKKGGIDNA